MPSIKDETTVEAIAQIFCSNGRWQEKAMVEVGYTKTYARSYCGQLWADPRLIAAIARIDAVGAKEQAVTTESLATMHQEAYDLAKTCNQPAAMNGAASGLAKLYGLDKTEANVQAMQINITLPDKELPDIDLERK